MSQSSLYTVTIHVTQRPKVISSQLWHIVERNCELSLYRGINSHILTQKHWCSFTHEAQEARSGAKNTHKPCFLSFSTVPLRSKAGRGWDLQQIIGQLWRTTACASQSAQTGSGLRPMTICSAQLGGVCFHSHRKRNVATICSTDRLRRLQLCTVLTITTN